MAQDTVFSHITEINVQVFMWAVHRPTRPNSTPWAPQLLPLSADNICTSFPVEGANVDANRNALLVLRECMSVLMDLIYGHVDHTRCLQHYRGRVHQLHLPVNEPPENCVAGCYLIEVVPLALQILPGHSQTREYSSLGQVCRLSDAVSACSCKPGAGTCGGGRAGIGVARQLCGCCGAAGFGGGAFSTMGVRVHHTTHVSFRSEEIPARVVEVATPLLESPVDSFWVSDDLFSPCTCLMYSVLG